MGNDGHFCPGDRSGETPLVAAGRCKPPVLTRRSVRSICVLGLAIVLYGTLGPVFGSQQPWFAPVAKWVWVPPAIPADFNDTVTNVAVYIPVGVALHLLVRRRSRRRTLVRTGAEALLALVLAVGLSYVAELIQQAQPGRTSSLVDVGLNGCGALAGTLLAVHVQRWVRRLHAHIFGRIYTPAGLWQVLALVTVWSIVLLMLLPGDLRRPVFVAAAEPELGWTDIRRMLAYAAAGFFLAGALLLRGNPAARAGWKALLLAAGLAVGTEVLQSGLSGHVGSALHAVLSTLGAAAGTACGLWFVGAFPADRLPAVAPKPRPVRRHRLAFALPALLAVPMLMVMFGGGRALFGNAAHVGFEWIPFRAQFEQPFPHMAATLAEYAAAFGILTLTGLFLTAGRARTATLVLVVGLAGLFESLRALTRGSGDITGVVMAIVAWGLAMHVWNVLHVRGGGQAPMAGAD